MPSVTGAMTLVEFSITATATTYSASYVGNDFIANKFTHSRVDLAGTSVFMVAEQIGPPATESGLMILRKVGATKEFYNYIENNNNLLKLIDMKAIDG